MVQADPDRDLKIAFIERQKRLFNNILNQLQESNKKGITTDEQLHQFKNAYNEIVYEDAKNAYTRYKLRHIKKKEYHDDLFSAEV